VFLIPERFAASMGDVGYGHLLALPSGNPLQLVIRLLGGPLLEGRRTSVNDPEQIHF
jgi:hypothetical protein